MEEKHTDKSLELSGQVKSINVDKMEITFILKYPPYLKSAEDRARHFLKNLLQQTIKFHTRHSCSSYGI